MSDISAKSGIGSGVIVARRGGKDDQGQRKDSNRAARRGGHDGAAWHLRRTVLASIWLDMMPEWCHTGAMQLDRHLERLRDRLALAAEGEREEEARAAQRLIASLDDSVRLMLLDVLAAAAAEITRDLAPASVELRLREGEPEFVVSAPAERSGRDAGDGGGGSDETPGDAAAGEGALARINLRLSEQLKGRVEQAAEQDGLSINAWLVRAAAAAVDRGRSTGGESGPSYGVQRYKGWGR